MIQQVSLTLPPFPRGFHLITAEVLAALGSLPHTGICQVFIRHTSAALAINEAADPSVLRDMVRFFDLLAPERLSGIEHTLEGDDDMPAHVKAVLAGASLSIPIQEGRLALGTWQGIYLGEFRNRGGRRQLLITVMGE